MSSFEPDRPVAGATARSKTTLNRDRVAEMSGSEFEKESRDCGRWVRLLENLWQFCQQDSRLNHTQIARSCNPRDRRFNKSLVNV
ncbi:hypothetical protein [Oxynema aestuarii]|uniref:Uncharacterized protein n=1 Tax=Oxynema aestuarii AP17 TaxID=2064643 RepID=A0A6H1TVD1_9CYAN|nr:hypothetical protein [Oxynema aestuarii]QIZ69713.1 hypothetical protein HCG48_03230 [Oxynema aestuarii AP17]